MVRGLKESLEQRRMLEERIQVEIEELYRCSDNQYLAYRVQDQIVPYGNLIEVLCKKIVDETDVVSLGVHVYQWREETLKLGLSLGLPETEFNRIKDVSVDNDLPGRVYRENCICRQKVGEIETEPIRKVLSTLAVEQIEVYPIAFDGEVFGCLSLSTADRMKQDARETFVIEATEQIGLILKNNRLKEELQAELTRCMILEDEFKLVLDNSSELVCVLNHCGQIEQVGKMWTELLGWDEGELKGKSILTFFSEEECEDSLEQLENLFQSTYTGDVRSIYCKDGTKKWISWKIGLRDEWGRYFCSGVDVTEQIEQEKERKVLEEAVLMESMKNEFFTQISHDLRTPINIILSAAQMIERGGENHLKHLPLLKQNANRLLRLVNNILDMAKIDNGSYGLKLVNVDIVKVVEDITLSVVNYIEEQQIKLIFDTEMEEQMLACDPDKIERIMLNLLSNAIKFLPPQGELEVNIHDGGEQIGISVKDNGCGISPEKVPIIFDRYVQGKSSEHQSVGTGLGLSLVKALVELHGGVVSVESELGGGSCFHFTIPKEIVEAEEVVLEVGRIEQSAMEKCNVEFADIYC